MISLQHLRAALGGEITGNQVLCPGPGHSRRDRSLAVRPSDTSRFGFVAHSHAGDSWPEIRDYVCGRLGIDLGRPPAPVDHVAQMRRRAAAEAREKIDCDARKRRALAIWREAGGLHGTLAETYLASRAIPFSAIRTTSLRYHPECPFGEERVPAMVALMHDVTTTEPVAIHRTRLSLEGTKVDRKMLGPAAGAAVMLDEDAAVTQGLVLGEGFETCLAARRIGYAPAWAAGSVGGIATFPVLNGIESISLLRENDEPSRRATEACAQRWHEAGREVRIIRPLVGSDLNDALVEIGYG